MRMTENIILASVTIGRDEFEWRNPFGDVFCNDRFAGTTCDTESRWLEYVSNLRHLQHLSDTKGIMR